MNSTTWQWFCESLAEAESKKPSFDRLKFYKEYFENVSPTGFDVSIKNDQIIITLSEGRKDND
jgi:hypothetical protein